MADNPFVPPTLTGFNSQPPSDDGARTASNAARWSTILSKIGSPLKTYAQALSAAVTAAFDGLTAEFIGSKLYVRTAAEIAAGVTPTAYKYDPGDVRRYGATGDSSNDDTTAINNALKSCLNVWIPESGTFIFTALRIPAGVTFFSKGGTLKFKDNVAVNGATSYFPIATCDGSFNVNPADNVTIRDLVIDGNKANNTLYLVCDAITVGGTNVQVLNNRITNPPDSGIMWSGVIGGRCVGNYISGAPDAGIYSNDSTGSFSARVSVISHNVCIGCVSDGIGIKRYLSLIHVNNNTIYECGVGINTEDFGGGINPNYVQISNNLIARSGLGAGAGGSGYGIAVLKGIGNQVNNNLIYDCLAAHLSITGSSHSTYNGNVIIGTVNGGAASHGIWSIPDTGKANDYNTITGNKVYGVKKFGIYLQNNVVTANTGNKINGNTVFGSSDEALVVSDTYKNGEICDNDLSGTAFDLDYAIANGTVVANRVSGNILRNGNYNGDTGWQTGSYHQIWGASKKLTSGTASPTVGTWSVGDRAENNAPAVGQPKGWRCTVAGTSGTWVSEGNL